MSPRVALDGDYRLVRGDHVEVADGVDAGGDVVARDHVLRGDVEGDRAQVNADHAVDDRYQQDQSGPLLADQAAEAEDDAALVLAQNADGGREQDRKQEAESDQEPSRTVIGCALLLGRGCRWFGARSA
jgi:hypothetical protein